MISVFLNGCDRQQNEIVEPEREVPASRMIMAVGDSLTAGLRVAEEDSYPARLEQLLVASGLNYRVINGGISGETSSGALARINWILKAKPDIVILETGANDGLRGIDPDLVRENIENSIKILLENKVGVVLTGMNMTANLGADYVKRFNSIYPDLAARYPVIFMPFFLEEVAAEPELNQPDGIHPTGEGYRIIAENLLPYVKEAIRIHEESAQ